MSEQQPTLTEIKDALKPEFERLNRKFEALSHDTNKATALGVMLATQFNLPGYSKTHDKMTQQLDDEFKKKCRKIDDEIDNQHASM